MAKNFYNPTRMCVSCRQRSAQDKLLRLQCKDGELQTFDKVGRSFYLCNSCLENEKRVTKSLMRFCKTPEKDKLMNKLKEIITDDRKS